LYGASDSIEGKPAGPLHVPFRLHRRSALVPLNMSMQARRGELWAFETDASSRFLPFRFHSPTKVSDDLPV
jgi:hypothetical protein